MLNTEIRSLKPERLWQHFAEILEIPRPSKKEEKIIAHLKKFGEEHGLETLVDDLGNVLIRKPASPGYENRKTVVLQSHTDMVCEKNNDVEHDFEKDPIISRIVDGWVKATGTTLGADDGIGIAAQLAILEAKDIEHGPIECLFTMDEETGLTGAFGLDPNWLKGRVLLNLDSEDDGELFIGCAGGKDTLAEFNLITQKTAPGNCSMIVRLGGLKGGHSGDEIQKGLGNAVKLMNRFLWEMDNKFGIEIHDFTAGNLRNAIAREAEAIICFDLNDASDIKTKVKEFEAIFKAEYSVTEPDLFFVAEEKLGIDTVWQPELQKSVLNALYSCPHGVIAWSQQIDNFVETSTNLAAIKTVDDKILVTTSQRSSVESAKEDIGNMVASVFKLAGAKVWHTDGYPGWTPNPESEVVDITAKTYKELFDQEPKVLAIHAGLECGLIGEKFPGMDMISYGPTIKGAHSPDERIKIDTVEKFWDLTLEVLKRIP